MSVQLGHQVSRIYRCAACKATHVCAGAPTLVPAIMPTMTSDIGQPEAIYHYTTGAGLYGILESGHLWATKATYLNDSNELLTGFQTAARLLRQRSGKLAIIPQPIAEAMASITENQGFQNIFVTSFCEDPDLLSQWRGYAAGQGGSYALGLRFADLNAAAADAGWSVMRCVYSVEEQEAAMTASLGEWVEKRVSLMDPKVLEGVTLEEFHRGHEKTYALRVFFGYVTRVVAALKDVAFAEENEWRLVSPSLYALPKNRDQFRFRQGPTSLVPYTTFKLPSDPGGKSSRIGNIYIGPGGSREAASSAVSTLLGTRSIAYDGLRYSTIPYRATR